jgi:O-antigen/teichoic acid export membrane protein
MELSSCLTCGHDCSKSAKACPNCGQPDPTNLPPTNSEKLETYLVFLAIGVTVYLLLAWIFSSSMTTFIIAAIIGAVIFALAFLFIHLAKAVVNWERSIGFILFLPPAIWGFINFNDHQYLKVFIAAILCMPGLYIIIINSDDK